LLESAVETLDELIARWVEQEELARIKAREAAKRAPKKGD
jgi:hypothetical protein